MYVTVLLRKVDGVNTTLALGSLFLNPLSSIITAAQRP
jgi:hypothetical protein